MRIAWASAWLGAALSVAVDVGAAPPLPSQEGARPSRALAPKGHDDAVLLLGVHLEAIEGYGPMFSSEGKPRTDTRPGYRTLVVRTHDGAVEIVGELPFVAVPQESGFLFLGEASVSLHLPDDPRVTLYDGSPKPRDYDATALWRTTDAGRAGSEERSARAALMRAKAWGTESTEQIVYVTQRALCKATTESEVTGGALYFHASSQLALAPLGSAVVASTVAPHVTEADFVRFTARLAEVDPSDIELDRPFLYSSFDVMVWRDDVVACLGRGRGALHLTGAMRVTANSARSFMRSAFVGPAPGAIAPGHEVVDLEEVEAVVPGAVDALVAPAHDVVLALRTPEGRPRELVVWDVVRGTVRSTAPLPGRPIMDEWATGERAATWVKLLAPHLRKRAQADPPRAQR